jgi:Mrp family chromosome partitioning ATPase
MIDIHAAAEERLNGRAAKRNRRIIHDDDQSLNAPPEASEATNFLSFQNTAEQALHAQKQDTALTLSDEAAAKLRALPLAKAEIERIRSEILVLNQRHGALSLGFASAQKDEGTSTILANLVADLKKTDLRILVVDLNVQHPNLPSLFSLPNKPGLVELIHEHRSLADVIRVVKSGKIFVLPLGEPKKSTEFELEPALRAINAAGKNSRYFDLMLYDFPPLNEVSQSIYAGRQIDGIIQVVQAEHTRAEVVKALKSKFEQLGVHLFGVILNQRRFHIPKLIYENL